MSFFKVGRRSNGHEPAPTPEADGVAESVVIEHRALPPPEPLTLPAGPYRNNDEHVWDELRRIDYLVRAQTVRWQWALGRNKPEHLWGMVHVTEAEINTYLEASFVPPHSIPDELQNLLEPYWRAAEKTAAAIQMRRAETPPELNLRLDRLQALFGLSDLERDIILVCLLPELDAGYRRLYGYLQDDASRTRPSVELALQILYPAIPHPKDGRAAFDAAGPLLAHHLIVVENTLPGDAPLPVRAIRLDDRIGDYLLGNDRPDNRLIDLLSFAPSEFAWEQLVIEEAHLAHLQSLAGWWQQYRAAGGGAALFLSGPYGSGRSAAAWAICAATDTPMLGVELAGIAPGKEKWMLLVDLCYREAALYDAALYWAGCETLLEENQPTDRWDYLIATAERYTGLTLLASHKTWDPVGRFRDRPFLRLEFPVPGYSLRRRLWDHHLPPAETFIETNLGRDLLIEALANGFQLTEGQIIDSLSTAWGQATQREPLSPRLSVDDLYTGCRRQSSRRLMTLAKRIEPRTSLTFDDLILPGPNKRQLEELRLRVSNRSRVYTDLGFEQRLSLGKGLIALFTGSSGTGKTMAAELLAYEQGVDLYKVDLSAVVSKYVGETEKNLGKVFAEAEDANAIIFFDEADALFGKRGEVKEARDRWANIEINYLLQRIEEYAGVVIMASNLRQNIDEAFLRRIHTIVDFPFPDATARLQIWKGLFPKGLSYPPDQELQILADRFNLSGGSLKNIAIDAGFRALAGTPAQTPTITMRHLVASTGREYQKLGKPITKGEFGETFYRWVEVDILS